MQITMYIQNESRSYQKLSISQRFWVICENIFPGGDEQTLVLELFFFYFVYQYQQMHQKKFLSCWI